MNKRSRKKLLSLLLTVAMVLTLLPTWAAADTVPEGAVAYVTDNLGNPVTTNSDLGNGYYSADKLQTAFTQAGMYNNGTLKLVADVTTCTMTAAGNLTLDLNGHTLSANDIPIRFNDNGLEGQSLTIKDTSTTQGGCLNDTRSDNLHALTVGNNSTVCIEGGVFTSGSNACILVGPFGCSLTITGGWFKGIIEAPPDNATVKISGGYFSVEPNMQYIESGCTLELNTDTNKTTYPYRVVGGSAPSGGDTVPTGAVAYVTDSVGAPVTTDSDLGNGYYSADNLETAFTQAGTNNGTLKLVADVVRTTLVYPSGNLTLDLNGHTMSGNWDLIYFNQSGTPGATLVIKDTSEAQNGCLSTATSGLSPLNVGDGSIVRIEGGTIKSASDMDDKWISIAGGGSLTITGGCFRGWLVVPEGTTVQISGGYFSTPNTNKGMLSESGFLAEGCSLELNTDTNKTDYQYRVVGGSAPSGGDDSGRTVEVGTAEALKAAKETLQPGDTIKLTNNIVMVGSDCEHIAFLNRGGYCIDLNGYDLYCNVLCEGDGVTLTIDDSTGNNEGTLHGTVSAVGNGTVRLAGGTFDDSNDKYLIVNPDGTLVIDGGRINRDIPLHKHDSGTVEINGGEFAGHLYRVMNSYSDVLIPFDDPTCGILGEGATLTDRGEYYDGYRYLVTSPGSGGGDDSGDTREVGTAEALKAAMEALQPGDTIKLTADIETVGSDYDTIYFFSQGECYIDLNGHELYCNVNCGGTGVTLVIDDSSGTNTGTLHGTVSVVDGGTVRLAGGTFDHSSDEYLMVNPGGNLVIDGGRINGNVPIFTPGNGTIKINGGEFAGNKYKDMTVCGDGGISFDDPTYGILGEGATLTDRGESYGGYRYLVTSPGSGGGEDDSGNTREVSSSETLNAAMLDLLPGDTIKLTNNIDTTGGGCVGLLFTSQGEYYIDLNGYRLDCDVNCGGTDVTLTIRDGTGNNEGTLYGFVATGGGGTVRLTGGTFDYSNNNYLSVNPDGTLVIDGGRIKGNVPLYKHDSSSTIKINGGTFEDNRYTLNTGVNELHYFDEEGYSILGEGATLHSNGISPYTYYVTSGSGGGGDDSGRILTVGEGGAYATLDAAMLALQPGDTIKLTNNINAMGSAGEVLTFMIPGECYIDLNGHELCCIVNCSGTDVTLTIDDSSGTNTGALHGSVATGNGGTVRLAGGTFDYSDNGQYLLVNSDGKLVIDGGRINGGVPLWKHYDNGTIEINGGEFAGNQYIIRTEDSSEQRSFDDPTYGILGEGATLHSDGTPPYTYYVTSPGSDAPEDAVVKVGTTYYNDLKEAVDAALEANATLVLLRDVNDGDYKVGGVVDTLTVLAGKKLCVDQNGHKWLLEDYDGEIVDVAKKSIVTVTVQKDTDVLGASPVTELRIGDSVTVNISIDKAYAGAYLVVSFADGFTVTKATGWVKYDETADGTVYVFNDQVGSAAAGNLGGTFTLTVAENAEDADNVQVVPVKSVGIVSDSDSSASTIPDDYEVINPAVVKLIAKTLVVSQVSGNLTKTYDGQPFDFAAALNVTDSATEDSVTDYTVLYWDTANSTWAALPMLVNAGTYPSMKLQVSATGYTDPVEVDDFTVTIEKAEIPTAWYTVSAQTGLVYDGEAKTLVTETISGSTGTAELDIEYSLDGTEWSTECPTATEVAEYTVYYRVKDTATTKNYSDTEGTANVSAAITVAEHWVVVKENYAPDYDLLLVFTKGTEKWKYDGKTLASLTNFSYKLNKEKNNLSTGESDVAEGPFETYALLVPDAVNQTKLSHCASSTTCASLSVATANLKAGAGKTKAYDLNGDKMVNIKDATAAYQISIANTSTYFTEGMELLRNILRADVNSDGKVDFEDYTPIMSDYLPAATT